MSKQKRNQKSPLFGGGSNKTEPAEFPQGTLSAYEKYVKRLPPPSATNVNRMARKSGRQAFLEENLAKVEKERREKLAREKKAREKKDRTEKIRGAVNRKVVVELAAPDGRVWELHNDGGIYRTTEGAVIAIVEDKDSYLRAIGGLTNKFGDTLLRVSHNRLTEAECKGIFEAFFDKYDFEVLCWYGYALTDNSLVFYVPEQRCTKSSVDVEKGELSLFAKEASIVGNIHSHPGKNLPTQSSVDLGDMKRSPGVHGIVSQDNDWAWYASVQQAVFELDKTLNTERVHKIVGKVPKIVTKDGVSVDSRITGPKPFPDSSRDFSWTHPQGFFASVIPIEQAKVLITADGRGLMVYETGDYDSAVNMVDTQETLTGIPLEDYLKEGHDAS